MLSLFNFEEIWDSLKQHKNRNLLTGFGVAWGIFILVLLVGAGSGLQKGIMILFKDYTQNSLWIYGGETSMSKPGQRSGRSISFQEQDLELFARRYPEIKQISPEVRYLGKTLRSKQGSCRRFECIGVKSNYFNIKTFQAEKGRLINGLDEKSKAKVAVIGKHIAKTLFGKDKAVGKYFFLDDAWFRVVGILTEKSMFSDNQNQIYIPYSSLKEQYNSGKKITCFAISLQKSSSPLKFEAYFKRYLAKKYTFHIDDKNAIYIDNLQADAKSFNSLFKSIKIFLWVVGICMLLSGIVGVSNIMLVLVKERTQEIGIRKAIGAPPKNILYMILNESIIITLFAGIAGLLSALLMIFVINTVINSIILDKASIFKGLDFNLPIAIGALVLLILSGAIAGLYPARKAASVMPIHALNSNNQ